VDNDKFLQTVRKIRVQGDSMSISQLDQLISRLIYDRDMRAERRKYQEQEREARIIADMKHHTPLSVLAEHAGEEDEDAEA